LHDDGHVRLAMLNMMLAIGTIGMQTAQQQRWSTEDRSHYFVKARLLEPDLITMTSVPTRKNIQLQVLYGLYFIASYQVNKSSRSLAI
jgi:hypothetical protein